MSFVPAVLEIIGVILLAPLILGITLIEAAILGTVLAAVSPAVIIPRMLHLMESGYGRKKSIPQLILAGASVDDIFNIVLFTAFMGLAGGGSFQPSTLLQVPASIVSGLAVMALGATVLKRYEKLAKRISGKFSKIWVAAELVLFVLLGSAVDISYAAKAGFGVVLLILAVLLFRFAGVIISLAATGLNRKEKLFCMIAYIPKATVQAAIGSLPLAAGLPAGPVILTAAAIAILITAPLGAIGIDLTYRGLLDKPANSEYNGTI
jgi:NhaP-type Na+/H+ or K+/H+ antiporter